MGREPESNRWLTPNVEEVRESVRLQGLREARLARGMSQVAFARRLGISRPTLIKAERGLEISAATARTLAIALELIRPVPTGEERSAAEVAV